MSMKDFQVLCRLGDGSYSSVWKVKRLSDGQEYAMKKVKLGTLTEKERENSLNEVRILASINDPNIVGYKQSFFEDNSMTLCIVMEYAGGGDIYNKIVQHQKKGTSFLEEDIWRIFIQMVKGLKTLHDMKILHRDLKCANIFIGADGKTIKLGDLNVSKVAKGNLAYTQTGTPYYASPEVWKDQPYDAKSDIWSLGCVLYEIATLKPPFRANDMEGLFKKVQKGIFEKIPSHYSSDLYTIICQCLQISPSLRPTCDDFLTNPIVIKHTRKLLTQTPPHHIQDESTTTNNKHELLKTIKVPKNLKTLGQHLPKANYRVNQSLDAGRPPKAFKPEEIEGRSISSSGGSGNNSSVNGRNGGGANGGGNKRAISQQDIILNELKQQPSKPSLQKEIGANAAQYNLLDGGGGGGGGGSGGGGGGYNSDRSKNKPYQLDLDCALEPNVNKSLNNGGGGGVYSAKVLKKISHGLPIPPSGLNAVKNEMLLIPSKDKLSKQDELINKYQNRACELSDRDRNNNNNSKEYSYQRLLKDKESNSNNLVKKCDYSLIKQSPQKGYLPPLQPILANNQLSSRNGTPQSINRRNSKDILIKGYENYKQGHGTPDYSHNPRYRRRLYDREISTPYMAKAELSYDYGNGGSNSNNHRSQCNGISKQSPIYHNGNNNHKKPLLIQQKPKPVWWG